jgi:hypothetical protein
MKRQGFIALALSLSEVPSQLNFAAIRMLGAHLDSSTSIT